MVVVTAITAALAFIWLGGGLCENSLCDGKRWHIAGLFGHLHARSRSPGQHSISGFSLRWGSPPFGVNGSGVYFSYDWWGTVLVFFAMVSNIFVKIGCMVFFYRFRRRDFNGFWHILLPILD